MYRITSQSSTALIRCIPLTAKSYVFGYVQIIQTSLLRLYFPIISNTTGDIQVHTLGRSVSTRKSDEIDGKNNF